MPFPYSDQARGAVQQPVTHVVRVEAAGRTLDNLKAASITFDEGQLPYAEFDAKCTLPDDQAYLDSLDPRTGARLKVWAGYRYQSGVVEAPLIADLVLSDREVVRPDDTLSLTATSRETRLGESGVIETFRPVADAQRDTHAVLSQIVKLAFPTATIRNEAVRNLYTPSEPLIIEPGDNLLNAAVDLANAGPDLWFYEDGLGIWHVADRPKIGPAEAILAVGENGTIQSGVTTLSRDSFANAILVEHRWRPEGATTDRIVRGYAEQTPGPLGTVAAGRTLKVLKRTTPMGLDRANLSAQGVLSRTLSRGRGFHLEAVSHLWLRPGDTVTVQMPAGPQERHLVAAVTFDLKSGRMRVTTRQPADRELAEDN